MKNIKDNYFDYLKNEKKASDNTIASYKADINKFEDYLTKRKLHLEKAGKKDIVNYFEELSQKDASSSTAARSLAALRSFYGYLKETEAAFKNPMESIKGHKAERKLPEILTGMEVEILLNEPDEEEILGCRDKALLELLYATGMRATELIELNVENVNIQVGYINCVHGGKTRVIPIYADAARAIKNYISKARPKLVRDNTDALFLNYNGTRLSRQGFWKIIKGYKESAKIVKEITPQTIRHSFAVHLLENGADLKSLKEMLGYNDVSSTRIYSSIVKQRLQSVYNNAHPKAIKK